MQLNRLIETRSCERNGCLKVGDAIGSVEVLTAAMYLRELKIVTETESGNCVLRLRWIEHRERNRKLELKLMKKNKETKE